MPRAATASDESTAWWQARRWRYNVGLVVAGLLAFVCYVTVAWTAVERIDPGVEVTVFTTFFQSIGYLFAIGVANVCYYLGPVSERVLRPRDPACYRRVAFRLGFWFSVLLPFTIPALLLYLAVYHPDQFQHREFSP
jgi:ABC-type uncharacterized transport system permease subunit